MINSNNILLKLKEIMNLISHLYKIFNKIMIVVNQILKLEENNKIQVIIIFIQIKMMKIKIKTVIKR